MAAGWIKISRDITKHWLWSDAERLKWWLDLLLRANWEDEKMLDDGHLFILKRGQQLASISFLAKRWKKSERTIINFLKMLENEQMIVREVLHRQTPLLTICNYEKYQDDVQGIVQGQVQGQRQGIVQGIVQGNKRIKEDKEIKEDNNMSETSNFEQIFEDFRKAYKGSKRGLKVEFENFKKKYPKEWRDILPLLMPALEKWEAHRAAVKAHGDFLPQYPMLQTWINQARWTAEYPSYDNPQSQTPAPKKPRSFDEEEDFGGADY